MKAFSYSIIFILLVIFTFMFYETREGDFEHKPWTEDELSQSQQLEEPINQEIVSVLMDEQIIAENKATDCSKKAPIASHVVPCSYEQLLPDENLMANSSLIMLSQSYRA